MNWLTNVVRPKIRNMLRRETPENLWIKCPDSGQLVFYKDVEANQFVIPGSNYHMRMGAMARLKCSARDSSFENPRNTFQEEGADHDEERSLNDTVGRAEHAGLERVRRYGESGSL